MRNTYGTIRKFLTFAVFMILLFLLAVSLNLNSDKAIAIDKILRDKKNNDFGNDSVKVIFPANKVLSELGESIPPFLTEPVTYAPITESTASKTEEITENSSSETTTGEPIEYPSTQDESGFTLTYPTQLPASDSVSSDYFGDALFIGDSRTVGFCNYTGISKYSYAMVSLNIKSVLTNAFIEDRDWETGEPVMRTVLDTLRIYPKAFGKVYISFGVNEYSWQGSLFIACYEYFLDKIIEILPEDTVIYIQSILPVNEKQAAEHGYRVKNYQLAEFNKLLADMADRYGINFVNTAEAVYYNERFAIERGVAGDGIHFNKSACLKIKDYLFTHTYRENKEDYILPETTTETETETTAEQTETKVPVQTDPPDEETVRSEETEPETEPAVTKEPENSESTAKTEPPTPVTEEPVTTHITMV